MKCKVFDATDKSVSFRLIEDGDMVKVVVVDDNGNRITDGSILSISSDGIKVYQRVHHSIPIKRGDKNELAVQII